MDKLFSLVVLERAEIDLNAGICEIPPGSNDGPRIREYLKTFGLTAPNDYCASAVGTWIREAEQITGLKAPILGSPGALATMNQLQVAGRWLDKNKVQISDLKPGMLVVWKRANSDGTFTWRGHIGVLHSPGLEHFFTVEANATLLPNNGKQNGGVSMKEHSLTDPLLLGFGYLD